MSTRLELERQLAIARKELADLPVDAFNERITIRDHIIELEAAVAAATPVPQEELRSELEMLRTRRAHLVEARMNPSNASGGLGLGGGIDPNFLHKANRKIDLLTGIEEVEARIREIERKLG